MRCADAASSTILGPVPAELDAASSCHRVSFFHQPTLERKLRSLFDAPEASCDDAAGVAAVVAACCKGAPCARLVRGGEVSGVSVGDDGIVSLSVTRGDDASCAVAALSCRCIYLKRACTAPHP